MSEKLVNESAVATLQTSMDSIITHPTLDPLQDTDRPRGKGTAKRLKR